MSKWLPGESGGSRFHSCEFTPGSTEYLPDHLFSRTLPEIGEKPAVPFTHLLIHLFTRPAVFMILCKRDYRITTIRSFQVPGSREMAEIPAGPFASFTRPT
jgi:hypothetical protein